MKTSRKAIGAALVALLAVGSLAFALGASGDNGKGKRDDNGKGGDIVRSSLGPSAPGDPAIHGVQPGAVAWELEQGSVRLRRDRRLRVRVEELLVKGTNNTGPVTTVSASLYCAPEASGAADTTAAVRLSRRGDARIDERITVPATCFAPVVLVHPNGDATRYIAAEGKKS
jgi:hypothetical protein